MFASRSLLRRGVTVLAILAVAGLAWSSRSDLEVLKEISVATLLLLVAVQTVGLVPQSYRYKLLVESHSATTLEPVSWFRIFVTSTLLNQFVMQAGLVYRQAALKRTAGIGLTAYVGSYASFAWLSLALNTGFAAALLGSFSRDVRLGPGPGWIVMSGVTVAVVVMPYALNAGAQRLGVENRLLRAVAEILATSTDLPRQPALALRFLSATVVTTILGAVQIVIIGDALGAGIGWGEAVLFLALVQVSNLIVISPGNVGLRELAFSAVGGALATGAVNGLLVSAVSRATGIVALLVAMVSANVIERVRSRSSIVDGEGTGP